MILLKKNMIRVFFILSLFIAAGAGTEVAGQETEVDLEEMINGHVYKVNGLIYNNTSVIQQAGHENQVTSIQEQQGKQSNFIDVEQLNQGNKALVIQKGTGHGTMLIQDGTGNEANIHSEGILTVTKVMQEGNQNVINSTIENRIELPVGARLVQEGNNNIMNFSLENNAYQNQSTPASVSQFGNNLEINAAFDSYSTPVTIEQNSGPGGGGMKVNISTSDFNFPMR